MIYCSHPHLIIGLLQDILMEIQEERQKQEISGHESVVGNEYDRNGNILVACKDEHSCIQLQDCITKGQHKVFKHYLYLACP